MEFAFSQDLLMGATSQMSTQLGVSSTGDSWCSGDSQSLLSSQNSGLASRVPSLPPPASVEIGNKKFKHSLPNWRKAQNNAANEIQMRRFEADGRDLKLCLREIGTNLSSIPPFVAKALQEATVYLAKQMDEFTESHTGQKKELDQVLGNLFVAMDELKEGLGHEERFESLDKAAQLGQDRMESLEKKLENIQESVQALAKELNGRRVLDEEKHDDTAKKQVAIIESLTKKFETVGETVQGLVKDLNGKLEQVLEKSQQQMESLSKKVESVEGSFQNLAKEVNGKLNHVLDEQMQSNDEIKDESSELIRQFVTYQRGGGGESHLATSTPMSSSIMKSGSKRSKRMLIVDYEESSLFDDQLFC